MIDLLLEIRKIKEVARRGWAMRGVEKTESVADHSFMTVALAELLAPKDIDKGKVLQMLIVHDLAEIYVGDLTPVESLYKHKPEMEEKALKKLFENNKEYIAIWKEFEDQKTKEARFAKQIDKLEMVLQALEYSKSNGRMAEFFESTEKLLSTNEFPKITELYKEARKRFKNGKDI